MSHILKSHDEGINNVDFSNIDYGMDGVYRIGYKGRHKSITGGIHDHSGYSSTFGIGEVDGLIFEDGLFSFIL